MPKIAEFATVVLDLVAEELEVTKDQILSKSRVAEVVDARHTAVKLLHCNNVYPSKIAAVFNVLPRSIHYADKEFAEYDVSQIVYTDREGKKHTGAYWTCEQIEEATKAMTSPSGTTKYDKWVAFNLAYSDFCKKFDDAQILQIGYLFFFADEDWGSNSKVWQYVACKNGL